jgi:nucleoside 2-deoxyribosyltransferase
MTTIYLCGPINGRTDDDARGWRESVKAQWDGDTLDPMRRDYRGQEMEPGIAAEIVAGDLEDLAACDVVLVYFDKPSVGTAMEVFHAHYNLCKLVVVIDTSDKPLSPWLVHHSAFVCRSVQAALAYLKAHA